MRDFRENLRIHSTYMHSIVLLCIFDSLHEYSPGPKVIKLVSGSVHLSMKFQLIIKYTMVKNKDFSCLLTRQCCIYYAHKC